jgi:hypothetical protein
MKIFKTDENMTTIVSMVKNAREYVVIVSPVNDLSGWEELKNTLNEAVKDSLNMGFYVRKGEGMNGMDGLEVPVFEVPLLHAKMFFSEKEAIISSGNLTHKPDLNWTCLLDRQEEYEQIVSFFNRHIKPLAEPLNNTLV